MKTIDYGKVPAWMSWMLMWDEIIPWYSGYMYLGHTMKRNREGSLLIVRLQKADKKFVCFYGGYEPIDCVKQLAGDLRRGTLAPQPDKYA